MVVLKFNTIFFLYFESTPSSKKYNLAKFYVNNKEGLKSKNRSTSWQQLLLTIFPAFMHQIKIAISIYVDLVVEQLLLHCIV
jgi:hypothetical protein